ncbi:MAG: hypothetical protein ACKO5R_07390 [Planctomycetaceae bacterium]
MPPDPGSLWRFLPWGYLCTVAIEVPVLLLGLSRGHPLRDRLTAGLALTAFTYPIVVAVLPPLVWEPWGRGAYVAVAESFAPVAEWALFRAAFRAPADRRAALRDAGAILAANLASFAAGEALGPLWAG